MATAGDLLHWPIWGDAFKDPGAGYSEAKVKEQIDGVVEYLRTLQVPSN